MSIYQYSRFKICIDAESKKKQGLKEGDVARRQYTDNHAEVYTLMIVLETGTEIIGKEESSYFIGALIEGAEPQNGELLDFIRIGNLFDSERSGAMYMTASDSAAPYLDVIDGLASDQSLCYPITAGDYPEPANPQKYSCLGKAYLDYNYTDKTEYATRIFRISRNQAPLQEEKIGVYQILEYCPSYPNRLIISFKHRSNKETEAFPVSFGYSDFSESEGRFSLYPKTTWSYDVFVINIDFPEKYQRSFFIDLQNLSPGDWLEIADLNIITQSSVSQFSQASKSRIGKIRGIADPLFGVLEGYGAYFQNLYATHNVNIAGTLTAADENGFGATFYVGKIHKNVVLNSSSGIFTNGSEIDTPTPVGVGKVWEINKGSSIQVQTKEWRDSHCGMKYCFSAWIKADCPAIQIFQDEHYAGSIEVLSPGKWQRYYLCFTILGSPSPTMDIRFGPTANGVQLTAPQLECSDKPSQYQATDGILSYTEDYGAWFSKGGIGGTIQNPLLKLNDDGSICSRNESFYIHPDGSGYFANGRFRWNRDEIILQGVTLRWEDFDEETQTNLQPIILEIESNEGFSIKNDDNDVDVRAALYRNGEEVDPKGTEYTYTWKLMNRKGDAVLRTFTGKTGLVERAEITEKSALICEVSL